MFTFRNQSQTRRERVTLIIASCALLLTFSGAGVYRIQITSGKTIAGNLAAKSNELTTTDGLSDLPGTDWAVLPYQTMPDIFAFCRSGRWELQSNTPFGGRYQISASRIVMTLDDGSTYADCRVSKREGNEIYLKCDNDDLHLRYHGTVDCK